MRRRARVDANQSMIVKLLRQLGCSVQLLHTVGDGCPDALIGVAGKNYLVEIKDGSKPPSSRKLTDDESKWHNTWNGQVVVIENAEQVVEFVRNVTSSNGK